VGGEIFRTRPDRPWGPHSLLNNKYLVFSVGKRSEEWRWPPTPSSAEVKKRVQLYFYSPFGPSWTVLGWPLPFTIVLSFTSVLPTGMNPHKEIFSVTER